MKALEAEWNTLLSASSADCLFLTWEWISSWIEIAGANVDPWFVVVRDAGDGLVGVAPFYLAHTRLLGVVGFRTLRIASDHATGFEYGDWIVDASVEREVYAEIGHELARRRRAWDIIWMPRMSGWSGALERITRAADDASLPWHERPHPFSAVPLPSSLAEYEEGMSSNRRQQMRRKKRKLLGTDGVSIKACERTEDLPAFLDKLFELHHRRRMLLDDPGTFERKPATASFYRAFAARALDRGWLRLIAMLQGDDIVAIQIGYAYGGVFHQLQEGFDPDYVDGAGNVLRHIVIEQCIDEGLGAYDFLGGFTEHKRRWGAELREGHDLIIGSPRIKSRLLLRADVWPTGRLMTEGGLYDGPDA